MLWKSPGDTRERGAVGNEEHWEAQGGTGKEGSWRLRH